MRTIVVVVIGAVLVAFVLVAFFRGLTKIERNQNPSQGDGLGGA
jgi:hypothetical protein